MKREQGDRAIYRLAGAMLIVGVVLLLSARLWRWSSEPAATTTESVVESMAVEVGQPAEPVVVATRRSANTDGNSDIVARDPGVIDRQARMLRDQAAASEKSEAGPSRLALTEEQIQELERKQVILQ